MGENFFVIIIVCLAVFFIGLRICGIFSGKDPACDCDHGNNCTDCPSSGTNDSITERDLEKDN